MRVRVDLVSGAPSTEAEPRGWPWDPRRVTAVAIDVLRATTTLTVALTHGAARVIPVPDPERAFAERALDPSVLLCGERGGFKIPGFDLGNSPEECDFATVSGRTLVFASTNGSRAMLACAGFGERRLAAFVNVSAVVDSLAGSEFVRLVCAGKEGAYALEDAACAGWLCAALEARGARLDGEQARFARTVTPGNAGEIRALLQGSAHGRTLRSLSPTFARDVEFCASLDMIDRAFGF